MKSVKTNCRRLSPFLNKLFFATVALLMLTNPKAAKTQNSPLIAISNADCVATDALGRSLPTYAEVGGPKPNRYVGLFYWQWHGPDRWGKDYNVTEFLKTHPGFKDFQAHPKGGPNSPTWYWAEPLFGYYLSTDPWVIRKHLALLADAGVDFLFLDYTNGSIYDAELKQFLAVAEDMKAKGVRVPRLAFFLNSEPEWKIEALYRTWYKPGQYDDMWFRWSGKPLLLASRPVQPVKMKDPSLLPAIQDYFTWRPTWAFHDAAKEPTKWRFMDGFTDGGSQRPALGPDGKVEQMVVSKSLGGPLWNNMETGSVSSAPGHVPIYNDQWVSPTAAQGIFFQAQWDNAERIAAPMLLVTGWNEWTASVWETPGVVFLGRTTKSGQGHIVDEFNQDFNRDLEPMKGGYGDDYYNQFVSNMRRYKGMTAPTPPSAPRTIKPAESYKQWDGVRPIYRNDGGIAARDWDGATPHSHYTDHSARNDITLAQVARDGDNVYFHVQASTPLTTPAGRNWMLLLVSTGTNTGWHGYDYLINRDRANGHCTVERNVGGIWAWKPVGTASYHRQGQDLTLAVPRKLLGVPASRGPLALDFKWADGLPDRPDIIDFYGQGDVAPRARFSYRFAEQARQAH